MAAALVAVMLMVGCGGDEESSSDTTAAPPITSTTLSQVQLDEQKAQRVVLTADDLPGFTEDAPEPDEESPEVQAAVYACLNNDPLLMQLGEDNDPRGHGAPDFSNGDMTASSSVTFGETEDQARAAIAALSATSFPTCFSAALTAELRRDGSLTNVSVTTTKLPALTVGDQSVGYRSVARFRAGGQSPTVYADNTFIRVGRGLSVLETSSVGTAFPEAERTRLATTTAGRMAAA